MMHANTREEVEEVYAGDIAAGVGLKQTTTGDTLCAPDAPIRLENISFPDPVVHVSIEPKTKVDQEKMGVALARLGEEDPTFQVRTDEDTGQIVISGMGELHLEVIVDRMLREFKVDATVGKPQVAYRETIRRAIEKVDYRHVKQTGGKGQYAHVVINLEPTGPGGGYEFVDLIKGGKIPREYIPSVDAGIEEALEQGIVAGYPLQRAASVLPGVVVDGQRRPNSRGDAGVGLAGLAFRRQPQQHHGEGDHRNKHDGRKEDPQTSAEGHSSVTLKPRLPLAFRPWCRPG